MNRNEESVAEYGKRLRGKGKRGEMLLLEDKRRGWRVEESWRECMRGWSMGGWAKGWGARRDL